MAVEHGDGWSLATLDDLGQGPGVRKIRISVGGDGGYVGRDGVPLDDADFE